MTISGNHDTRFKLPTRIRAQGKPRSDLKVRLDLIDRIADLGDIRVTEREDVTVPCRVDVVLQGSAPRRVVCSFSRDGITIRGLDRWARYQVLSRGWGTLDGDDVVVHLPRDAAEVETVWRIFKRAYDQHHVSSDREQGMQLVSTWDWPKFSRTSLQ